MMETIWLCVLQRYATPELFRAIALSSKAGASACRRIRDLVSVSDEFVATQQVHQSGGKIFCQTFLRSSGLLHGAYEKMGPNGETEVLYFKYGKPVHGRIEENLEAVLEASGMIVRRACAK